MSAFRDHSAKVAVWKAAIGDTSELVAMLRSGEPIPMSAREQLALLHEGRLLPNKRDRGRPVPELTPSIAIAVQEFSKISNALREYELRAAILKQEKRFRGKARELMEEIADDFDVTFAQLSDAKKNPSRAKKLAGYELDEAAPFRRWLEGREVIDRLVQTPRK